MPSKRIEDMIKTGKLGDVSRQEMLSFLLHEGYREAGGKGGHTKLVKQVGSNYNMIVLPGGRVLRKDQVRYILREGQYI